MIVRLVAHIAAVLVFVFGFVMLIGMQMTPGDVRLIRNWARYGGSPFSRGAGQIERLYELLSEG